MDEALVQKWLEQGERIETRYLDVLQKNKANGGITDGSDSFRQIYYHFDQLNDAQIDEIIKILNGFQRGKSSGDKGREIVKEFLSNSLILLASEQDRQELKQYLDKNGLMPVDNSEELRLHEEERRLEQERLRRQQEEEQRRRAEEERRRRELERQRREEAKRLDADRKRGDMELYEQAINRYTTERELYVVEKMKKKKFNIPWKTVLKVIGVIFLIYLFFTVIGFIKGCVSSTISSSLSSSSSEKPYTYNGTQGSYGEDESFETSNDQLDDASHNLYGSLPEGTTTYSGDMGGYPIELKITKDLEKGLTAFYRNVNYGTTMTLEGTNLSRRDDNGLYFWGSVQGQTLSLDLTGDKDKITGTAYGDNIELPVTLYPK